MSKFFRTVTSSYKKKNLLGRGLIKVEKHWFRLLVQYSEGPRFRPNDFEIYIYKKSLKKICLLL
jgi:hypothetical protein